MSTVVFISVRNASRIFLVGSQEAAATCLNVAQKKNKGTKKIREWLKQKT